MAKKEIDFRIVFWGLGDNAGVYEAYKKCESIVEILEFYNLIVTNKEYVSVTKFDHKNTEEIVIIDATKDWYKDNGEDCDSIPEIDFTEVDTTNLELFDGGDGVEHEIWKDTKTKQYFNVPIEIVRNFNDMTEVTDSYSEDEY